MSYFSVNAVALAGADHIGIGFYAVYIITLYIFNQAYMPNPFERREVNAQH